MKAKLFYEDDLLKLFSDIGKWQKEKNVRIYDMFGRMFVYRAVTVYEIPSDGNKQP